MNEDATTISERVQRIADLDLEPLKFKLMVEGHKEWTLQRADAAGREYKRFLVLTVKHPGQRLVPAGDIDEMWHAHILDTAKYAADCAFALGHFLHHFPYSGLLDAADSESHRADFAKTCELYVLEFGAPYASASETVKCSHCRDCDAAAADVRPRPRVSRQAELAV